MTDEVRLWSMQGFIELSQWRSKHVQQISQSPSHEQYFTVDHRGDSRNVEYGSLDQYKLPRYRTAGHGRLIGLDRRFRISTISDSQRQVDDEAADSTRKYPTTLLLGSDHLQEDKTTHGADGSESKNDFILQADFIQLPQDEPRKDEPTFTSSSDLFQRGLQDELPARNSPSDSELNHSAFDDFRNDPANKRNVELSRAIAQDPQDFQSWMLLIEHQESLFRISLPPGQKYLSAANNQAISEMKISLYEKALTNVKSPPDVISLVRGLMTEGRKVWDTSRMVTEWASALKKTPSLSLWKDFLTFQQTTPVLFSYTKCLELYSRVLKEASASTGNVDALAHLILRLTMFMHQAGYAETSIAVWQAVFETTFFTPSSIQPEEMVTSFENFWESEAARIGEEHGQGWLDSTHLPGQSQRDDTPPEIGGQQIWNDWAQAEKDFSDKHFMPARTMDDTADNDPFRVILFSDIRELLVPLHGLNCQNAVIQALLMFCGLPIMQQNKSAGWTWLNDAFLFTERQLTEQLLLESIATDTSILIGSGDTPFNCFSSKTVSSFSSPTLTFAMRILTRLTEKLHDFDYLAEYTLALKFAVNPVAARKDAKSLLKKRSDRPRLYNMYALIEARSDRLAAAENIWSTAISMRTSFKPDLQREVVLLWDSWIWELLAARKFTRALRLLIIALPSGNLDLHQATETSNSLIYVEDEVLQARLCLSNLITTSIQQEDIDGAIACTNLLAILNYLSNNHDPDEATRTYASTLSSFSEKADIHTSERIHQSRARLLHLHASQSPTGYRPIKIVTALKESKDLFPNNSIIHNLFETYSRRAGLVDRLRSIDMQIRTPHPSNNHHKHNIDHNDLQPSIIPTMLRISTELSRPLYSGNTPHSIRATFTKATSSDNPLRHCPAIWLTWLHWELSLIPPQPPNSPLSSQQPNQPFKIPHKQIQHLKDIYLSSLRACPWVKALYLQAFLHPLMRDHVLTEDDLDDVYRSMLDRGLRIRIDIEDRVDERRRQRRLGGNDRGLTRHGIT